ncbi:MAG: S-layer homology domain-containing protein, partial [Erysipelotrichaceae bacterium]|nr:S-layer homology domain-containing protein [Erysipelotrichaceae bacterium]
TALLLAVIMMLSVMSISVSAKTVNAGQTVGTVLFYVKNSNGEQVLVAEIPVSEMEKDMQAGKINSTNYNYSLLDRYTTTVHQEAQGFTVAEFVDYAQKKSGVSEIRNEKLTFAGNDKVAFWEIDQDSFDDKDAYTYTELYGTERYNFPLLYQYWNYRTQDYYDPEGVMSREQVIDYIFENGEPSVFILSVRAFSQRYMVTDEKYDAGDYNMENYWSANNLLDNQRTIRLMKPMTELELRNKVPTASDTRYWVSNILLDMEKDPAIKSKGKVAPPTAMMTEDDNYYYITFDCDTEGATILYNHNYISPSYTPTSEYTGGTVKVSKNEFPDGMVTMTCRAVKEGYTDAGVTTLKLKPSGTHVAWKNPYKDVNENSWYYDYVEYVSENGLFDAVSTGKFGPESPMTRQMLATALYRMAGSPAGYDIAETPFTDVSGNAGYADAVAWAYEAGVVNGMTETTFAPDASITREQIVTMFWRYAKNVADADMTATDNLALYVDAGKVMSYAKDSMKWAVGAGLINGMTESTPCQ